MLRSLPPVTGSSYRRAARIKPDFFLQTSLCFRDSVLAEHLLREVLGVSKLISLSAQSFKHLV